MSENQAPSEKPHSNDVLLVRKTIARKHKGNKILIRIAEAKMDQYQNAFFRDEKKMIAQDIVNEIKSLNPPGRFLEAENGNCSKWNEVDNARCVEKACQTLREVLKLRKQDITRKNSTMKEVKQIYHPSDVVSNPSIISNMKNEDYISKSFLAEIRNSPNSTESTQLIQQNPTIIDSKSDRFIQEKFEKKDSSYGGTVKQTYKPNTSRSINFNTDLTTSFMNNQDLKDDNSPATNISANKGDRKRRNQSRGKEASKKPKYGKEHSVSFCNQVILGPVSLIAQAFLSKPAFGAESRHLFESIAELDGNEDGLFHLPNIIARLCSRIEKLEEEAEPKGIIGI